MKIYRSYRNLPPLAGISSFEDALHPGFSVAECVRRLQAVGDQELQFSTSHEAVRPDLKTFSTSG